MQLPWMSCRGMGLLGALFSLSACAFGPVQSTSQPKDVALASAEPDSVILPSNFRGIPTVNHVTGSPGCYIAAYARDSANGVYSVGDGIYVMGQVRVSGTYEGRICQPEGYVGQDISAADHFKDLFDQTLPQVCRDRSCWAGGDTGGFVGAF